MIAGTNSGCGKTTVTCAVLQALVNRKINVSSFKCGPDYIDPMFHKTVIGTAAYNLDTYLMSNDAVNYLLNKNSGDIAVIEGVMGFYDGFSFTEKGSTHELSEITDTDVILVVNCRGMSLSAMALVKGFKEFRKNVQISSRHLGLVTAGEIDGIKDKMNLLADYAEKYIDIDKILEISENDRDTKFTSLEITKKYNVKIAVAYDRAFCFYYEDNLNLLSERGAEIVKFSPLENESVPQCDGLILGGGYPELYADILEKNTGTLNSVKECVESGVPCIAECGGFMYLHEIMEDSDKNEHGMVGIIKGTCRKTDRLQRFGYMEMTANRDNILCKKGDKIRAREFHYFDSDCNGNGFTAVKNDRQWECVNVDKNLFAGFPHLHFFANINFAENFMKSCEEYKCTKSEN